MTATGRRVRMAAVIVVLTLVTLGSIRGSDHDFPFGPFRMYSTSGRPTGAVRTAALVGVVDGRSFTLQPELIGVRRAELEGQYPRFEQDPKMLAALADAFADHGRPLDEIRLVERVRRIVNGHPVGRSSGHVLAVWKRPS